MIQEKTVVVKSLDDASDKLQVARVIKGEVKRIELPLVDIKIDKVNTLLDYHKMLEHQINQLKIQNEELIEQVRQLQDVNVDLLKAIKLLNDAQSAISNKLAIEGRI